MKLHRNAKTTPHMRALLVERVRVRRWRVSSAAKAAGVSRRTAFKWLGRWRDGGAAGLEDRPSTPLRQPRRTSPARVAGIVAARQQCLTAWAIGVQLQIPRSTVAAVLARLGLNRLARLAPVEPVIRYERSRPEYQRGLRNGFRPRRVRTAEGELEVEIPQVREAAEPFV